MAENQEVRALAIDDDDESRTTIERLSRYDVRCTAVPPPRADAFTEKIFKRIKEKEIDVVLLDFRLDDQSARGEKPVSYRGGMLAAAIKEKLLIPIVLVTTQEKLSEYVADNPRIRGLFDHTLLKSQVGGSPKDRRSAAAQIRNLAIGFRTIQDRLGRREIKNPRRSIRELLAIAPEELDRLEECLQTPVPAKPAEIASWLLQSLLEYPGPLLDENETRSRLGLTEKAFRNDKVRAWVDEARYQGVFGELKPRWWEGRILNGLREAAGDAVFGEARERATAIAAACGSRRLEAASCIWCQEGLVQRACYVCKEAVDATHHLTARVDERPAWALPAIVCFRCIETGRDEEIPAIRYGPGSGLLLDELKGSG